jgi:hypothetical protein
MKNLFLSATLLMVTTLVSANINEIENNIDKSASTGNVCCIRSSTTLTGEVVTVKGCIPSSGDAAIDKGKACERAEKAVKALVQALENTPAE